MTKPIPKEDIDLTELYRACQDYIDFIFSDDYHMDQSEDYEFAIIDTALETVYGEDIFDKINDKLEGCD